MKVRDFIEMGLINYDTLVVIRAEFKVLASGKWNQLPVLRYHASVVDSIEWENDNTVYIDLTL